MDRNRENLRGFTDHFAEEFMVPQVNFWKLNIDPGVKIGSGLMADYYDGMRAAVDDLKEKCSPPYKHHSGFPSHEVFLTTEEVEIFEGIIGDNYQYLEKRISEKNSLGVSFLPTDEEERKLEELKLFITEVAPGFSDARTKNLWVPFEKRWQSKVLGNPRAKIDSALGNIGGQLLEMRKGMWNTLESKTPDSGRQSIHSARELIDQTLKEGSPDGLSTRKERARYLVEKYRKEPVSESDIEIIDASWKLIDAENGKMQKLAHGRSIVAYDEARGSVDAAERILELLFGRD